jgi:transcriptional regulator with XRE-family HTH domain
MTKKAEYESVADMIRDMTDDDEVIDAVQEALDRQRIVRQLMAMRAAKGLSQAEVGKVMGCAQSRISKIEGSADSDLRYGDLSQYAEAVGCKLISGVRPQSVTPVDEVKCLAVAINDRLSRMAELSQQDEDIAQGVAKFLLEAHLSFSMIVGKAAAALPKNADSSPRIRIEVEVEVAKTANCQDETSDATEVECPASHQLAGA